MMWALVQLLLLLWVASSGSIFVLAEPSGSCISDLLKTAAINLGRSDHADLTKYKGKLEEDWITKPDELQGMDVKTLSNYMPWGLAHEVHAIVNTKTISVDDAQQQQYNREAANFDGSVINSMRARAASPNFNMYDMVGDDDDVDASSYFERNGLQTPPSAADAITRKRMLLQPSNNITSTSPILANKNNLTNIIEEAKTGNFHAARIRQDLLNPDVYDKHAYPWDYVWYGKKVGNRTGIPLEFNINFQKVAGVDVVNSVVDFVVWFRLVWYDPRLTWDPKEYGDLSEAWFWIGDGGAGGETSEIWTPDIELWNLEHGLKSTLEDAYAKVSSDGMVWWGRPGHLKPTCRFHGLNNFPFDHLTCAMEFGSWQYNGKFIQPVKHKGVGFNLGLSETGDTSYHEFTFVEKDPIDVYVRTYPPHDPPYEDGWPVMMYNVTVARSWQPYARTYITTQLALNVIGFAAFWLPPSCGERMGLSITAMLAAVASETIVAANLPASAETTWFSFFSLLSLGYAFISLLECVAVLHFFHKKEEDLVPSMWKTWTSRMKNMVKKKQKDDDSSTDGKMLEDEDEEMRAPRMTRHSTMIDEDGEFMDDPNPSDTGDSDPVPDHINNDAGNNRRRASRRTDLMKSYQESLADMMKEGNRDLAYLPRDANDFANDSERENNRRWKEVAARIDDICQIVIPLTFVIATAILFSQIAYKEERSRAEVGEAHNWTFSDFLQNETIDSL